MDDWSSRHIIHKPRQEQEVCQFSSIHVGPTLECYVASMDMIPLFGRLCNCLSTSTMHILMNSEGYEHMNEYMELMVHHTSFNAEDESAPVLIHPPMVHPLDIVWPVWM